MPKRSRIFLDYDDMGFFQVFEDVCRLMDKYNLKGPTDIYESSKSYLYDASFWGGGIVRLGSYHTRILETKEWNEVERILKDSNAHEGFKYFSLSDGIKDITLRISGKRGASSPRLICTIDENRGVEFHG